MNNIKTNLLVFWSGMLPFAFYALSQSHGSFSSALISLYVLLPILLFANDIISFIYQSRLRTKTEELKKNGNLNRREKDNNPKESHAVNIDVWS